MQRHLFLASFLLGALAVAGPRDSAKDHDPHEGKRTVLDRCDLFSSRVNRTPQEWGMEAVGVDLLRDHPAFHSIAPAVFEKKKIGLVDSGIRLRGNPAALGTSYDGKGEDKDEDGHGTASYGVISSDYGVDKRLRVAVFPWEQSKSGVPGHGGLMEAATFRALKNAVDDPDVKIINLSMVFHSDTIVDEIDRATKLGKIVVVAAGNDSEPVSAWKGHYAKLRTNPLVFEVGALNPYGTTASFSHYGTNVDIYAPGVQVRSLTNDYDPLSKETKTDTFVDGTSFAAPLVTGVLAKLWTAFPELPPASLLQAIRYSTIDRGGTPQVHQLNALLAAELLYRGHACLKGAKGENGMRACFEAEEKKIKVAVPSLPARLEIPADCEILAAYFRKLREGYLLTRGGREFGGALSGFLSQAGRFNDSDRYFYSPVGALTALLDKPNATGERMREEAKHLQSYHTGDFKELTEIGKLEPEFRSLMNGKKWDEAAAKYLQACAKHIFEKPIGRCGSLFPFRKSEFLEALAKQILKTKKPIGNAMAFFQDQSEPALIPLIPQLVEGWVSGMEKDTNAPRMLHGILSSMDLPTQEKFIATLEKMPKSRDFRVTKAYLKRKLTHDEEKEILTELEVEKFPREAALRFALIRRASRQIDPAEVMTALRKYVDAKEERPFYDLERALITLAEADRDFAVAWLSSLPSGTKLDQHLRIDQLDTLKSIVVRSFPPKEQGKKILDLTLLLANERGYSERVFNFLEKNKEIPELSAYLKGLTKLQSTEAGKNLRVWWLARESNEPGVDASTVKEFLSSYPDGFIGALYHLKPERVFLSPELTAMVKKEATSNQRAVMDWISRGGRWSKEIDDFVLAHAEKLTSDSHSLILLAWERGGAKLRETLTRTLAKSPEEWARSRFLEMVAESPDRDKILTAVPELKEKIITHY